MSYITAIETAVPKYSHLQKDIMRFFENSSLDPSVRRKIRAVANRSGIETRYSILPDFSLTSKDYKFFSKNLSKQPEPGISERMACFKKEAKKLSLQTIKKIKNFNSIKNSITHVITVSCTGLYAPGLDVELIRELQLKPNTQRSSLNFMGCNAAIMALNVANAIGNSMANSKILIVCVELCTIHFQSSYTDDDILSTSLFGDGCAAVIVDSNLSKSNSGRGLQMDAFNSYLIHEGEKDMAWQISEKGFLMNLNAQVSKHLSMNIIEFINAALPEREKIDLWAIHPGGKKILDDFSKTLGLKNNELKASYEILRNYGNMSSPTVLFVLKNLLDANKKIKIGTKIYAAAFGPGLSMEAVQLKYV